MCHRSTPSQHKQEDTQDLKWELFFTTFFDSVLGGCRNAQFIPSLQQLWPNNTWKECILNKALRPPQGCPFPFRHLALCNLQGKVIHVMKHTALLQNCKTASQLSFVNVPVQNYWSKRKILRTLSQILSGSALSWVRLQEALTSELQHTANAI